MFKNSSLGLGKQVLKVRLYQIGSVIDEKGVNSATAWRGDISLQKSVQFFEFFSRIDSRICINLSFRLCAKLCDFVEIFLWIWREE
jgi:hypothetical protein